MFLILFWYIKPYNYQSAFFLSRMIKVGECHNEEKDAANKYEFKELLIDTFPSEKNSVNDPELFINSNLVLNYLHL